jgi:DNA-binding MarR family transcriptional regulator
MTCIAGDVTYGQAAMVSCSNLDTSISVRSIKLSGDDIDAIRRVLLQLDNAVGTSQACVPRDHDLRRIARRILEFRRSRASFLNPAMLGEPAYEMLLCLYIAEDPGEPLTPARLAELTDVPHSSALRWIDYLVDKELVTRGAHPKDRRATVIDLTSKGKQALDDLLGTFHGMESAPANLNGEFEHSEA